jgi:8-oxo-dGTP diphosphatase
MKRKGSSILIVNDRGEILLLLRDNKPTIPYPNMWDVPGGHVEEGETPEQCIIREMKEEMELDLQGFGLFSVREFSDREEYVFWQRANLNIENIRLHEGQRLRWFTRDEAKQTQLACGFNGVVEDFYAEAPFKRSFPGFTYEVS